MTASVKTTDEHEAQAEAPRKKKRRFNQKWYAKYSGLLRATLCTSTDAKAGTVMFERGNPRWYETDQRHRAAVELLVAARCALDLAPVARERRRVGDHQPEALARVLAPAQLLHRVRALEAHAVHHAVALGVIRAGLEGLRIVVHRHYRGRAQVQGGQRQDA